MPVMPPKSPVLSNSSSNAVQLPSQEDLSSLVQFLVKLPADHVYIIPQKRISDESQLAIFPNTIAYKRYLRFLLILNNAAKNTKNTDSVLISESVQKIIDFLAILNSWIEEIPPLEGPQRFGNKAFKSWVERLEEKISELLSNIVPSSKTNAIPELIPYIIGGFGHPIRLDYGSGHEMSFVAWLCCLELIECLGEEDYPAILCKVFVQYVYIHDILVWVIEMIILVDI
ncbi:Serine/threonine-protein phosphatase 2A activator [Nowakowskiella sp. JEL0407]|nr:Serine/threonine-protein phosphatase 2A activator [Nowakowskiella sp. JEL0407]